MRLNVFFQEENESIKVDFGEIQTTTMADYNKLNNKPSINGHELNGNLTSADLDISSETDKSLTVSDMPADSKIVGDAFKKLSGNLFPRIMQSTRPPYNISFIWNSEKDHAEINAILRSDYYYSVYETIYDMEGSMSGWSEYLEYGKSYNIRFSSTSDDVALYIVDSNGERYSSGDDTFYVEEGSPWVIAFKLSSGDIHAFIDVSMPFTGSLIDLIPSKAQVAVLG